MTKTKILESTLLSLVVLCGKCGKEFHCTPTEYDYSSYEAECELCGSHGGVYVNVTCDCGYKAEITLKSW
jgi:hypothetical protein